MTSGVLHGRSVGPVLVRNMTARKQRVHTVLISNIMMQYHLQLESWKSWTFKWYQNQRSGDDEVTS